MGFYLVLKWVNHLILKCDCLGETVHKSGWNCLDCEWVECNGNINYSCYKLNTTISRFYDEIYPEGMMGKEFFTYLKSNSQEILCPPNYWNKVPCNNNNDCKDVLCELNSFGKAVCDKDGCHC